ncbi:MAG: peptide chain release factor N(5)-glutamine methyltransferase [Chloroflexi bacterium]|nr:peptide chain release factor N(5)-glutamine methyltransferase [Chloroflexota bacterium]
MSRFDRLTMSASDRLTMKLREAFVSAAERLAQGGIAEPSLEAEVLLRHVLGLDRASFFASLEEPLDSNAKARLDVLVERRLRREPLAYITGSREFFGLDFAVNPSVLIPRQETELLVEKAIEFASSREWQGPLTVADVGTGSGAIAIAIAHNVPNAIVYATDISASALEVADANRRRHGVAERVRLLEGDLLAPLSEAVDMLVSNPPYIETGEIARLSPEVRAEPALALDAGADGLDVVRRLFEQAPGYMRAGGCILVEIAPEQLEAVTKLALDAFPSARASFAKDLLGLPRVVSVCLT